MTIDAPAAAGIPTYRMVRELGSRSLRSYAAIREPHELVVVQRFTCSPRGAAEHGPGGGEDALPVSRQTMERLLGDARCLLTNWHPNIARVRYVDRIGDDLTIATELVDGLTLEDLLAAAARGKTGGDASAHRLPLPVVLRVLVDVLAGLHAVHVLRDGTTSLAAIHGEICPANIVVGKDGVARLVNVVRPRPVRVGASSEALGYAAPEALDVGGTSDARADVYAVGVILWEALMGRRLYEDRDPARIMARQREEEIPTPAVAASWGDAAFGGLGELAMHALAFDPALRFRTAVELTGALRRLLGSRLATGSVVAAKLGELAGDRIRARRTALDPRSTGMNRRASVEGFQAVASPAAETAAAPAPRVSFGEESGDRVTSPPASEPSTRVSLAAKPASAPAVPARAAPAPRPPPLVRRNAPLAPVKPGAAAPPRASPAPLLAASPAPAPELPPPLLAASPEPPPPLLAASPAPAPEPPPPLLAASPAPLLAASPAPAPELPPPLFALERHPHARPTALEPRAYASAPPEPRASEPVPAVPPVRESMATQPLWSAPAPSVPLAPVGSYARPSSRPEAMSTGTTMPITSPSEAPRDGGRETTDGIAVIWPPPRKARARVAVIAIMTALGMILVVALLRDAVLGSSRQDPAARTTARTGERPASTASEAAGSAGPQATALAEAEARAAEEARTRAAEVAARAPAATTPVEAEVDPAKPTPTPLATATPLTTPTPLAAPTPLTTPTPLAAPAAPTGEAVKAAPAAPAAPPARPPSGGATRPKTSTYDPLGI